jgi:hypothetical protein
MAGLVQRMLRRTNYLNDQVGCSPTRGRGEKQITVVVEEAGVVVE